MGLKLMLKLAQLLVAGSDVWRGSSKCWPLLHV